MSKRKWSSLPFRLFHRRDSRSRSRQSLKMLHMKILKDSENKLKLPWSTWKWTSKQIIRSSITFFKVKTTALPKSLASRIQWRICNLYKTAHSCQDWRRWDSNNSVITTTDLSTNKSDVVQHRNKLKVCKAKIKIKFSQHRCSHSCSQWCQFLSNNRRVRASCRHRTCSRMHRRLFQSWIKLRKWTCWENKIKCWANNFTCSKFSNNNLCIISRPWSLTATTARPSQKETNEEETSILKIDWNARIQIYLILLEKR